MGNPGDCNEVWKEGRSGRVLIQPGHFWWNQPVQLRQTDKSAIVQLRLTLRLTGRISDIYIIDGISHQTDSNSIEVTEAIKAFNRATDSRTTSTQLAFQAFTIIQSVHNFLQFYIIPVPLNSIMDHSPPAPQPPAERHYTVQPNSECIDCKTHHWGIGRR